MRALLLAALVPLLLAGGSARAADVKVTATFDALEVRPDDLLTYTITLSGTELPRLRRDPKPDFSAFQVASGPSRGSSTQVNIVGGRAQMSESLTLSWQLMPRGGKEGVLAVPGFEIVLGNEALRVPEATVKSTMEAKARRQQRQRDPFDPFGRRRPATGRSLDDVHLEVRARVPRTQVWVGEEIVLDHVLEFGSGAIVRTFEPEPIEFSGFEKQQRKVKHEARRISGKDWQEVPLAQWRLVPLTAGRKELPAQGYVLYLQPSSRDLFEPFFGGGEQRKRRQTNAIALDVRPLPPDAPASFGGAVGTFQIESSLGATELEQGDGTTLQVVIRGTGNFSNVKPPELVLPPGIRAFDPEVRDDTRASRNGRTTGAKIYEFPLLVEAAGDHRIDALDWSYFDPKSGRYVMRRTKDLALTATPSSQPMSSLPRAGGARTSVVETLDTDIHHVMSAWTPVSDRAARVQALPGWFWPSLVAGPLLPLLGLAWSLRKRLAGRNGRSARSRRASKDARRRLAEAQAAAKSGRSLEAADAASATVGRYVVDRCETGGAEPVASEVVRLVERHANAELAARVKAHLEACDFLRFAGSSAAAGDPRARADEAKALLAELERELSPGSEAAS